MLYTNFRSRKDCLLNFGDVNSYFCSVIVCNFCLVKDCSLEGASLKISLFSAEKKALVLPSG